LAYLNVVLTKGVEDIRMQDAWCCSKQQYRFPDRLGSLYCWCCTAPIITWCLLIGAVWRDKENKTGPK